MDIVKGYKQLYENGNLINQAQKIIKTENEIKLFNDGELFQYYPNIKDMNRFSLGKNQEWDIKTNKVEELNQAITELSMIVSMQMGE